MKFQKDTISVIIDAKEVTCIENKKYLHGMAGIGSGFNHIEIDNISIK